MNVIRQTFVVVSDGFVALTSLLIISAVAMAIAVSIALLGVNEMNNSLAFKKGEEVLKIAESCGEEALLGLRNGANYSGGTLNVGNGSCTMNISDVGGNKKIEIVATISGPPRYIRRLQIEAKRKGNAINILSWQEI